MDYETSPDIPCARRWVDDWFFIFGWTSHKSCSLKQFPELMLLTPAERSNCFHFHLLFIVCNLHHCIRNLTLLHTDICYMTVVAHSDTCLRTSMDRLLFSLFNSIFCTSLGGKESYYKNTGNAGGPILYWMYHKLPWGSAVGYVAFKCTSCWMNNND